MFNISHGAWGSQRSFCCVCVKVRGAPTAEFEARAAQTAAQIALARAQVLSQGCRRTLEEADPLRSLEHEDRCLNSPNPYRPHFNAVSSFWLRGLFSCAIGAFCARTVPCRPPAIEKTLAVCDSPLGARRFGAVYHSKIDTNYLFMKFEPRCAPHESSLQQRCTFWLWSAPEFD